MSSGFKIKLDLINDDTLSLAKGWTFKNYMFLQNFLAGTMPVAMVNSVMQAPNIYRVVIRGKNLFYWSTVTATLTCKGKQRQNTQLNKYLQSTYKIAAITSDTLWPEAWHLEITIKPLTPYSFSTYAYYLINGQNIALTSSAMQNANNVVGDYDGANLIIAGVANKGAGK